MMMLLTELRIKHNEDKYAEYLTKVEKVKFEMGELYRLHPNNFVKRCDDSTGNHHLHLHYRRSNTTLVNVDDLGWDERRMDVIGQNGNIGYAI